VSASERAAAGPLKVLHLAAGNLYGGIESMLVTLARLRERCPGMAPAFALCFPGRLSEELAAAGVPVHLLGAVRVRHPWSLWRARRALARVLEREGYHAAITHGAWVHALLGPAVVRRGLTCALFQHGLTDGRHWLERWAARVPPALVLANSRATADCLAPLFPGVPRAIVHPPLETGRPPLPAAEREALRAELGVPPGTPLLLHVGRMEAGKGHRLLLEALRRLPPSLPFTCLVVGGPQRPEESAYWEALCHQVEALGLQGRVRLLGQRADVPRLLRAADIYCQPNVSPDSFGLTFVEALDAGLPVLTTAMGGALEIVDARTGLLVEPEPKAVAAALERLLRDGGLREALGREGPARARALCDPAARMAELRSHLEALR
jgi:glycosyltransferase involved in cell wall biosynthesis